MRYRQWAQVRFLLVIAAVGLGLALVSASQGAGAGPSNFDGLHFRLEPPPSSFTLPPPRAEAATIFGTDDRVRVEDTKAWPYRLVVQLVMFDDADEIVGTCSGMLVNYNVALTAAHCLWDDDLGAPFASILIIPGQDGTEFPFGTGLVTAGSISIPVGYVDDVDAPIYDFGLAHLVVQDFGPELGPFVPVASASDDYFHGQGTSLFTAGYPGDKPLGTMWESIAPVEYVDDELIHTRMDAYPGQSGSPVFTLNFERVEAFIVGTYSTETAVSNRAVRFSPRHIDALNDYCADAGCTLSTAIVAAPTTTAVASPSPSPTPTATSTPTPTSTSIPSPSFPVRSRIPHLGRD